MSELLAKLRNWILSNPQLMSACQGYKNTLIIRNKYHSEAPSGWKDCIFWPTPPC